MSVYSFLKNNPKPTSLEIENTLDGNICRCTGYRAIMDTMKSFSIENSPIDIEDLHHTKCLNGKTKCHQKESFCTSNDGTNEWYAIESLSELNCLIVNSNTRFVSGNTSVGIFKNEGPFQCYINIKNINELNIIEKSGKNLFIGASITLTKLQSIFRKYAKEESDIFGHLDELASNLDKVGSTQIRNVATWAGNLALKKICSFPSDVLVILEAAKVKLNIHSLVVSEMEKFSSKLIQMSLADFLKDEHLKNGNYLIESLVLPGLEQSLHKIKVYKVGLRSTNSHAYVNAGNFI